MANKKISQLTPVVSVSDNDVFPVVQGSATLKAKISDIKSYLPTANGTTTGLLTNSDWTTFNGKQSALTFGNLTEATSSVLTISGGTGSVIGSGLTIQVKQASSSQSGYLSSTDWSTFNSKQNSLTLTTNGTSGAATLVGSTLNIPQYPSNAITSLNSQTGATQTFSTGTTGTDFTISSVSNDHKFSFPDASASARGLLTSTDWSTFNSKEPALTKGNLTETTSSVLTITGGTGAVIGSGLTIAVTRSTASTDGYLKASDFTTFAAKQDALTLTTTGTSGAATLVGSTLNIPQYSGGSGGITSLNALTGSTQTFATGTTGTDFGISSSGTTHTFNIPSASTSNRGLVTTSTQTFGGAKTIDSGSTATPLTITTTNTSNTVGAFQITANSGTRGMISSTNGQSQYTARVSNFADRELRFQVFSDGNCYFGMASTSGNISPDLIIRSSADSPSTNGGSIRFSLVGTNKAAITTNGIAIGSQAGALSANAYLHLMAGTAAANTAPLRFTSGTNLTTPVSGAVEFNGTNLFFTPSTTRQTVFHGNDAATAPATSAGSSFSNYYGSNSTNVLGTPNSWASVVISGTTYKIPLYT